METINKLKLKEILGNILESMQDAKDELIALDGAMGDGDLGLTMCKGFEAIYQEIDILEETDMGKLMMKLGMKMNSVVPSTMGTLISTCFVKSAPKAKGKSVLVVDKRPNIAGNVYTEKWAKLLLMVLCNVVVVKSVIKLC